MFSPRITVEFYKLHLARPGMAKYAELRNKRCSFYNFQDMADNKGAGREFMF